MPQNRYLPTDSLSHAALKLFALPSAGGGTAGYYRWRQSISPEVEISPIQLPGRESRIGEPSIADSRILVAEIADAVVPQTERPYVLVGHSMGALLAFELARELRRRGAPKPRLIIVAACPAPQEFKAPAAIHELPDAEFVAEMVRRYDGIPPAVASNRELMQLLLPALRADMQLLETYRYVDEVPLESDICALGGAEDRAVSASALGPWRRQTSGHFSSRLFPGGHFFLFSANEQSQSDPPAAVKAIIRMVERQLSD